MDNIVTNIYDLKIEIREIVQNLTITLQMRFDKS